ncbi:MAG TPA: hypothetical protein VIE65_22990 [Methylobacter sp.]|jgi:hypothetical protein
MVPLVPTSRAKRPSRQNLSSIEREVELELSEVMLAYRRAFDKFEHVSSFLNEAIRLTHLLKKASSEAEDLGSLKARSFDEILTGVSSINDALREVRTATDALISEKESSTLILRLHNHLCRSLDAAVESTSDIFKALLKVGSSFDGTISASFPAYQLGKRLRISEVLRTVHAAVANLSRIARISRALSSFHARAVQDLDSLRSRPGFD